MGMKTEIIVTADEESLPSDPEFEDQWNTMLVMELRLDLYLMNTADDLERFVDTFFLEIKQQVFNHFYQRYPERIPNANS